MKVIFNKYYILDNIELLWCYVALIILIMVVTVFLVNKELRSKK